MPEKRIVVYPYKMSSASAKLLASALKAPRVYPDRDYHPKENDVVVNWGNGNIPNWQKEIPVSRVLNNWKNVCFAINKMESFTKFVTFGVVIPQLTQKRGTAIDWLEEGQIVLGRKVLEGTRGAGIIEMAKPSQFQECYLYTKYEETTKEFRVYTFGGKFLDALEKRRDSDMLAENKINYRVRTEENGWVFCRNHVIVPANVASQAVLATKSLGLLFGGVDVIWNEKKQRAIVLEVNTAPGIFGTTVTKYAEEIQKFAANI